jgi:hypothetical protein
MALKTPKEGTEGNEEVENRAGEPLIFADLHG